DTEMIESGGTPRSPRIDVQADIAVAYGDSARWPGLGRCPHAEDSLVELRQLGIIVADDGNVVDLREHVTSLPSTLRRSSRWLSLPDFLVEGDRNCAALQRCP